MLCLRPVALALSFLLLAGESPAFQLPSIYDVERKKKKKKKKADEEPPTQVLDLPPDPPSAVVADTTRLAFYVAPLSNKGLLSQQVRDGLRAVLRATHGDPILRVRAFVAGTGDLRRVQTIVSETFSERKTSLPTLSVIQVGALPAEGAQVALEAVWLDRRAVNASGLAFLSGQQVEAAEPTLEMAPLVAKSLAQLQTAIAAVGLNAGDVRRVTCFVSSLSDFPKASAEVVRVFPQAAWNIVQIQRVPSRSLSECEAVAALSQAADSAVRMVNPNSLTKSDAYSQVALVSAPRVALTGSQMAFNQQDDDARLAFQRLDKSLDAVNTSLKNAVVASFYPLSQRSTELVRKVRWEFLDKAKPPASTLVPFEGLPSLDASFAMDVIAVVP